MTSTSTPLVTTIEGRDKRALLHADGGVTFHLIDGQGQIRAHKRGDHTPDGFDQMHTIFTDTRISDYGHEEPAAYLQELDAYAAFHSELGLLPRAERPLGTIVNRLRAGDTITLHWVRDNNNENNREIGWHRDELRLTINHQGPRSETFLVAVYVGPDNTARMIRRVRF